MTGVDVDKMRKDYEDRQKGGDFLQFDVGETLVYIHPPCRPDDEWEPTVGLNYVPVTVHYSVGTGKAMAVSLDPEANPIIDHPFIKKILKAKKIKLTGECPVGKALSDGTLDADSADDSRAQTRFLWGMTPIKFRSKSSAEWSNLSQKPTIAFIGKQIFDGIMEQFFDHGDISDPTDAVLLRIIKKGKDRQTKYEVKAEPATVKKHWVAPKTLKALLDKAMAEGGDCDLFRVVGNMIKSPSELEAMLDGAKVESDPDELDDTEDDEETTPPKKKAAKKPAKPEPEDDEEEDDEEEDDEEEDDEDDEEEAPPPKKKAAKKPAKPPVEEEDDEEEDDEDDEDDEEEAAPPAKPAKKAAKKPSKPADDDEEEDDEDEEEDDEDDEEEAAPPKKSSKAAKPEPKPAKKAKKPADEDEEEDLGLDDLKEALGDLDDDEDDEEEEEKPAKKPKKK